MALTLRINLASEPFRHDRPMVVASAALAVVMAGLLGMLLYLVSIKNDQGTETALAIERSKAELTKLETEDSRLQAELLRPENAAVLEKSMFLNALIVRKGISWTLIFRDLEEVLPFNVKLVQVRPQVVGASQVQLEMVVASRSPEPVIEMLRTMERSDLFSATSVLTALPPTDTEPLYRYRVNVNYERKL